MSVVVDAEKQVDANVLSMGSDSSTLEPIDKAAERKLLWKLDFILLPCLGTFSRLLHISTSTQSAGTDYTGQLWHILLIPSTEPTLEMRRPVQSRRTWDW